MTTPTVVPVNLGCCHEAVRCALCPPPPEAPTPDLVGGLVHHYRERAQGAPLRAGFYGGPPPPAELVRALDGLPFVARIRPDLLTRASAVELQASGAVGIEVDALTLRQRALRIVGRRYGRRMVMEQLEGLRAMGLKVGAVLAPGLPDTDHETTLEDAEAIAPQVDFVRIHPVLVFEECGLRDAHMNGRYHPLELGEAVTTCQSLLDLFESRGVDVIRVGQSPGPDGLGRAVAGPRHTALRQLVEARRTLRRLQSRFLSTAPGSRVAIRCHPADETHTRGPYNQHIRTLRAQHGLAELRVRPDPDLPRGEFVLDREGDA